MTLRELGDEIHAVGGEQPDGESRPKRDALHLQFESLAARFEGRDTLAIGWKPVFVAAFRIAAERGDVEGGIAIEELAQLLRHSRAFFDALVVRESSKIKIFGSLREIPGAAELEKRKYGALRGVAMERVFGFRGHCGCRGRRGAGNGLGAGGGAEDHQRAKEHDR